MAETFDVVVVGGGPVGACLAALLARVDLPNALRIAVLEPKRPKLPAADAPMDLRVVACSRASERILAAAGAWSAIASHRISPYERMRVWHESVAPTSSSALVFDAAEAGEPNLGYIIENRLVQAAALDAAAQAGVQIEPAELKAVRIGEEAVQIETSVGSLSAKLIVGADGANS